MFPKSDLVRSFVLVTVGDKIARLLLRVVPLWKKERKGSLDLTPTEEKKKEGGKTFFLLAIPYPRIAFIRVADRLLLLYVTKRPFKCS